MLMLQLTAVMTFAKSNSGTEASASDVPFVPTYKEGSYGEFLQNYSRENVPDVKIDFDLANPVASEGISYGTVDGKSNVLQTSEEGYIEFEVDVPATGLYSIGVTYYPIKGKSAAIEREVLINGEYQFTEAHSVSLDRIYKDNVEDLTDFESFFTEDAYGNQTRRQQVENPKWIEDAYIKDSSAAYNGALKFYLEKGKNLIRIASVREPCAFAGIWLYGATQAKEYGTVVLDQIAYRTGGDQMIAKVQTEYPWAKNDPTLFASYDRASAATEPPSSDTIKLNTMGGNQSGDPRWKISGQWVEYKVNVETEGLYKIIMRARQNTLNGGFASREIIVNNEVQFAEAQNIKFTYSSDWEMVTPVDEYGEVLLFHFKAGENIIRFKAVYGEMGDIINGIEAVITKLNKDYRKILMITGSNPDTYRDYEFQDSIPEVIADLKAQADILRNIHDELINILGQSGQYTAMIENVYNQLYRMYDEPDHIAKDFSAFKNNITNLGSWLLDVRSQPLEIDYFIVAEENYKAPKAEAGFFQSFFFQVKLFFSSFFTDFNSISSADTGAYTEKCTVWTMTARDQAQVLRQIIDRDFIPQYEIDLDFELVPGAALLPSILAGKGPDVVLGIDTGSIVNYATRGALEALNDYENFDKIISERFVPGATTGMTVQIYDENRNKVMRTYGIPETMSFPMLFYRSDILEELNKEVPKTWDESYTLIPILQKRYMDYAPPDFNTLLYQKGGSLYKYDGQATDIDSDLAIETFVQYTDFYTAYGLPISYSFTNRFRMGEMPIGNSDLYSFYNTMSVFAPEIKGLWTFTTIPGTVREDGTIDNHAIASFTGTVMLKNAKEKANSWKFMQWWTSDDIQTDFGREIESVLGSAGRYNSANVNAILNMNWSAAEEKAIKSQLQNIIPYPTMIADYYLSRYYGFSFNSAVVEYADPREAILDNVKFINEEIIKKRIELDLPRDFVSED